MSAWRRVLRVLLLPAVVTMLAAPASAELTREAAARLREAPLNSYDITVRIDPATRKYSGSEKVTFQHRHKNSTNYVLFFLYPNDPGITKTRDRYMTVTHVRAGGRDARVEEKGPSLRVYLPEALKAGDTVTIDMDFAAEIPKQAVNKDLFTQAMEQIQSILNPDPSAQPDYGIFSSGSEILNLGLWYPALSKFDEDGWDEEAYSGIGDVSYYDPADFRVRVSVPSTYRVVTTGEALGKPATRSGRTEYDMEGRLSRDFVIEMSRSFEHKDAVLGETTIRSHYLSRHGKTGADVLDAAVRAFEYYGKAFGPYPYTDLDVVEAPLYGGAGGVEFPGLVTIASMFYLDPASEKEDSLQKMLFSSPGFADLVEFVVAHEVAHQWWNAVVGSNSKKYPYIDEAMANYSAVLYFEHYYGREAAEKQMALQMKLNYQLHRFAGGLDRPVSLPASSYNGPLEYSAIVYGKGALYFDSLRSLMGDAAFQSALRRYYNEYWFRIAGPGDFTRIAEGQLPAKKEQIQAAYKRWIEGEHGDEDIGPGTIEALMPLIVSTNPDALSEDQKQLLEQLEQLLKALSE